MKLGAPPCGTDVLEDAGDGGNLVLLQKAVWLFGVDGDEDFVVRGELRAGGGGGRRADGIHGGQVGHQAPAIDAPVRVEIGDQRVVGIREAALVESDAELPHVGQVDVGDPDPDGGAGDALVGRARRGGRGCLGTAGNDGADQQGDPNEQDHTPTDEGHARTLTMAWGVAGSPD